MIKRRELLVGSVGAAVATSVAAAAAREPGNSNGSPQSNEQQDLASQGALLRPSNTALRPYGTPTKEGGVHAEGTTTRGKSGGRQVAACRREGRLQS